MEKRESIIIPITPSEVKKLVKDEIKVDKFIEGLFDQVKDYEFRERYLEELTTKLSYYYDDEGGAPEVDVLCFTDGVFNKQKRKGSININFSIFRFYGCDDINSTTEDYQKWEFEIVNDNTQIKFLGEIVYERDDEI